MTADDRGRPLWGGFVLLAAAIVIADQVTKALLVGALAPGESVAVIGDLVRLVHGRNTGGLFGMFRDAAPVFAAASIVVVGLITWYHGQAGRSPYLTLTLGLLLGGAIGNLIDRIARGYVVDFVDAGMGTLRWYTFNVADAAISASLLLLVLLALRPSLGEPRAATGGSDSRDGTDAPADTDGSAGRDGAADPDASAGAGTRGDPSAPADA